MSAPAAAVAPPAAGRSGGAGAASGCGGSIPAGGPPAGGGAGAARGLPLGAAVARLRRGRLIAYPTETVYGLGADATSERAVERLARFKGRDPASPISILVSSAGALEPLGFEVPPAARRLAAVFWPGPVTLVLPCRRAFATGIARADGAVGVRCARHPTAEALARRLEQAGAGPITATSLNRSGRPAAHTREEAQALCTADPADADAPQLVEEEAPDVEEERARATQEPRAGRMWERERAGGRAEPDAGRPRESTVIDLTGSGPVILRPGALPPDILHAALEGSAPADAGSAAR